MLKGTPSDREGWLVKADMSTHTKWRRRYFMLYGRRLLYFRSLPRASKDVAPAGQLTITARSTVEISEEAPRTFCLNLRENLSLHATAPTSEDFAGWLRSLRAAINVEIKISETEKSDSEEETETTALDECKLEPKNHRWAILEPMKGLFSQLIDQYAPIRSEAHDESKQSSMSSSTASSPSNNALFQQPLRPDVAIPQIVRQCCEFLSSKDSIEVEGILRVSGQQKVVENIRKMLDDNAGDEGNCLREHLRIASDSPSFDVYNVGTLLKLYLSSLPEPIISRVCYPHLLRAQKMSSLRRKLAVMTAVVNDGLMLPPPHRRCLMYLLHFLRQVGQHRAKNKMTPSNLAVCFAPTLLRVPPRPKGTDAAAMMAEICTTIETLKTMIMYVQIPCDDDATTWLDKPVVFSKDRPAACNADKSKESKCAMPAASCDVSSTATTREARNDVSKCRRPPKGSASNPEIPLVRPFEAPTSSILAVRAKGSVDQKPYILYLNRDTKEFSVLRRTRNIFAEDLECCVIDKTEESSQSVPDSLITGHIVLLNVKPDQTIRIRVDTPAQAIEWVTAINNVVELCRVANTQRDMYSGDVDSFNDNDDDGSVELTGVHIGSDVWILDNGCDKWRKVYVELTSQALHWANVTDMRNTITDAGRRIEHAELSAIPERRTSWKNLRVGKLHAVGRRHNYFAIGAAAETGPHRLKLPGCSSLRWRVEVRLARAQGTLWHRMLLEIGKAMPSATNGQNVCIGQHRRASLAATTVSASSSKLLSMTCRADGFISSSQRRRSVCADARHGNGYETTSGAARAAEDLPFFTQDQDSASCMLCNSTFTLFLRRHHCRLCGRLICDKCSKGRIKCSSGDAERACDRCIISLFTNTSRSKCDTDRAGVMTRKERVRSEKARRAQHVLRLRKNVIETARSYEIQICKQRRALALCRQRYIEASERHADLASPCRVITPAKLPSGNTPTKICSNLAKNILFTPPRESENDCPKGEREMEKEDGLIFDGAKSAGLLKYR